MMLATSPSMAKVDIEMDVIDPADDIPPAFLILVWSQVFRFKSSWISKHAGRDAEWNAMNGNVNRLVILSPVESRRLLHGT